MGGFFPEVVILDTLEQVEASSYCRFFRAAIGTIRHVEPAIALVREDWEIALVTSNVKNWIRPGADGANLEVEDFLSRRITHLSLLLLRISTRRYLLEYEISLPEWRVLTMLVRHGPGTTRALRDASRMDRGQMSRALTGLEKRKLVQRTQDDTHELRHVLRISDKGRQLYERVIPNARRAQVGLLKHLTLDERRALDSVINKLNAVADAEE